MNIALLGAKILGSTLGKKWVQAGHTVKFGVRSVDNPDVVALVKSLGPNASVDTAANAIAFGEVVVFAIPGEAVAETVQANAKSMGGKIVIDAANNVGAAAMNNAAAFAAHAPSAQVFRAFNTLGWENLDNPQFDGIQADMFYCGPDGEACSRIEQLITEVGLRPIRVGGLDQVQLVDAIGGLWFTLAFGQGMGRQLAFKALTR